MIKKLFGVDKMVEQEKQQYLDAVAKLERQQKENEQLKQRIDEVLRSEQQLKVEMERTTKEMEQAKKDFNELQQQLEDETYVSQCGFYTDLNQLVFTYGSTVEYKQAIENNLQQQKEMIENKTVCKWQDNALYYNSKKQIENTTKLVIRCFNSECNTTINNIGRSSLETVTRKIQKSFDQINTLMKVNKVQMSDEFLELKLEEAKLVFEQQLKNKEEKELEAQRRAELREQEKLEKEIQKEKDKALKEKQQYLKEMARLAKQKQQTQELLDRIAELEAQVNAIDETIDSLDERGSVTCKAGWVYIISQPGSDEVKIGTTRRLDPYERINELGSASVPFKFNTHAVLFAEDAFALENQLHKYFNEKRVNKANIRKEFFTVTPQEVAEYVHNNIDKYVEFDFNPINEEYEMSK